MAKRKAPTRRREVPSKRNAYRKTPRMLARCLSVLRRSTPETSVEEMAERLAVAEATIRKWERPDDDQGIRYAYLERYQDWYGVPVGVFLMISHMAAAVRDERQDELKTLARMMRLLADRVLKRGNNVDLIKVPQREKPVDQSFDDWDRVLADLISTISRTIPADQRVLRNRERLDHYRKLYRQRQLDEEA
jgi:transcriptional regulator with XRE-family HTH domain